MQQLGLYEQLITEVLARQLNRQRFYIGERALDAADSREGLALKFRLSEGASGEHDPYADVFATH